MLLDGNKVISNCMFNVFSDDPADVGIGCEQWSRGQFHPIRAPRRWLGHTRSSALRPDPQHSAVEVMS